MERLNFSTMTTPQLVSFYNENSPKPVTRFSDRKTAERRCAELFCSMKPADVPSRPNMQTSLKLDRTITCVETGETWKNAHQMWVAHPDWMNSGQQDRMTSQLYAAAKACVQRRVAVNGRTFMLVNVPEKTQ